ncbi:MAG: dehypoxanthine futalosine cyclase [Deltaproteobacteria bacterium]|nr:MAG: dehypoxanthine futalosine cyclase [Deltaproteobacteria bacterium]
MNRLNPIIEKIDTARRIGRREARILLADAPLLTLGGLANRIRRRLHPEPGVTYIVDRNINFSNICVTGCRFCAFYRPPDHPEAYRLNDTDLAQKIEETLDLGGTQILLQGGMHPDMVLADYESLLRSIRAFDIHIHGFSPPEIHYLAGKENLPLPVVIERLKSAGLGSIPGGGAEILVDRIRRQISPRKCTTAQWLDVMRTAHKSGLRTTATMMFGHVETVEDRIDHLMKIRDLQDETGGFTAFIPWTFQPHNTQIDVSPATSCEYLRMLAVSRIVLDNIPNIQASWVTQGAKIAQVALSFGANDLGSTMIEENVVAAAGIHFRLPKDEMIRLIEDAGYMAQQRDCFYRPVDSAS